MKTRVQFVKKLPSAAKMHEALGFKPEKFLVIHDRTLLKNANFKKWLGQFEHTYSVKGGEELKDMNHLSDHIRKIFKKATPFSGRNLCLIGVGGGSVGDFVGFVASVIKRGIPLIHIPTTLLAAMDSSHGGKTALNVGDIKNQVGTFYPADAVLISRKMFENLPALQIRSALGEFAKMALIEGGKVFSAFQAAAEPDLEFVWDLLPEVIEAKYRWVDKDPLEQTGDRQVLNFGHSLGHVLESYYRLPHGIAVGQGLIFSVLWSQHQGYLSSKEEHEALDLLQGKLKLLPPKEFAKKYRSMSRSRLEKYITEDKKLKDARHVNFIFLEKIGSPFRKPMTIEAFLTETQRQGWTQL